MGKARDAYEKLILHWKETATLESCAAVLGWDRETYMPKAAAAHRAEQLRSLSGIAHDRNIDPRVGDWLGECESSELVGDVISVEAVNIREIRRSYDKKINLPRSFVEELTRATSLAHQAWAEAREASKFSIFQPCLESIVRLKREYIGLQGGDDAPYDTLLDDFEPNASVAEIDEVFTDLSNELLPLIKEVRESSKQPTTSVLAGRFARDGQRSFGEAVAGAIGFDFDKGRLDTVLHPFCTGLGPADTRITTRWDEGNFASAFFGIIHEAGHGLYQQGLASEHWGTPMGDAVSLGIHESQSRLWENIICRGRPFWEYFYPKLQSSFPEQLGAVTQNRFLQAINHVELSLIRVEADEATYNLHIIIRFEIEQRLVTGALSVADIPEYWNQKYEERLGVQVPNDASGCLQDVHWAMGGIGYFPTYTLGNLYAAQFYDQAKKDLPDLEDQLAQGEYRQLLNWFRTKIHQEGMRFSARALVERITGKPLSHKFLVEYLRDKYTELYAL